MNRKVEIHNAYLSEMEAVGWSKLVDADRLKADTMLKESFSIIEKGKSAVKKYKIQNDALLDEARNDLKTLDIAESSKHRYAQSLERRISESRVHLDALWGLEEQALVQFENIVKLLAARKGKWIVQDRQILFESQEDLNAFNAYLERVQPLAQQQLLLRQKRDEATLANFERLKQ